MSHVLINKLVHSATVALREAVASVEFLESLTDRELVAIYSGISAVAASRQLVLEPAVKANEEPVVSAEAHCAQLQQRFGIDGNLQLTSLGGGQPPQQYMMTPTIPEVDYPFEFTTDESGDHIIVIKEPAINLNLLLTMSKLFRDNGVVGGYRQGDEFHVYVDEIKPDSMIKFHNVTTGKVFSVAGTLAGFAAWYTASLELIHSNLAQFQSN